MQTSWEIIDRLLAGRTDAWLAEQLAVSRSTVSSWRINGRVPKGERGLKLARVLGAEYSDLFDSPEQPEWPTPEAKSWLMRNKEHAVSLIELEKLSPSSLEENRRFLEFRVEELRRRE